jgi:hypothetical protein
MAQAVNDCVEYLVNILQEMIFQIKKFDHLRCHGLELFYVIYSAHGVV